LLSTLLEKIAKPLFLVGLLGNGMHGPNAQPDGQRYQRNLHPGEIGKYPAEIKGHQCLLLQIVPMWLKRREMLRCGYRGDGLRSPNSLEGVVSIV
jgi:hypothetical protein